MREAVALGVTHVSVYPLTIEPHTPFDAAVLSGEMSEPDDDAEAAHMEIAARVLAEAGFARWQATRERGSSAATTLPTGQVCRT